MEWTKEQKQAIETKDCKLLVSAGAGSGKTAVLVQRIIDKVIKDKIDIDRLLIVTFTNAAASEMRERIQDAIYKKLDEFPELSKQIVLLNKASIMTIDAFCKKVIKDNFFNINIDPNFAVCDSTESELLKLEALDEIMEELYEEGNEILDVYSDNKFDENFRNIILKIHSFIQSSPFPNEWLSEKCGMYNTSETDFGKTVWGKELIKYARNEIAGGIEELENIIEDLQFNKEAENYVLTLQDDVFQLKALRLNNITWDNFYNEISKIKFITLKRAPKLDEETAEDVKAVRNKVKDKIQKFLRDEIFISSSEEIFADIHSLYNNLKIISNVVIKFDERFKKKKSDKNLIDFSDMEHLCLELLNSNENIAKMYREKYQEILIDEYQDSNLIQEFIMNKISNGNLFMVGDVKQSIYKFRQARPELFLEKYNTYPVVEDDSKSLEQKILLFKNFRSNKNIIDECNFIFQRIMSKDVGEIDYDEVESLKFGAEYYPQLGETAEFHLIEKKLSEDEEISQEDNDIEDKPQLEARVVAKRIEELVGNFDVYDKKTGLMRKAMYKDFAILLRATKNYANYFIEELSVRNIPVFADVNSGYFDRTEVQVIMSLLKIIDNPYQDIPLLAVLRSKIGDFDVNELTQIRLIDKNCPYFEAMQKSVSQGNEKVLKFLDKLSEWREKSKHLKLGELIWLLYNETGYYDYVSLMSNGDVRKNNLDALLTKAEKYDSTSFKGLFNFINFIDNIKETTGDLSSSKSIGENDNVVRIMSIHKSKGLEFPIVFLCGTSKKFNTRDERNQVILHQDFGFGADVVNLENRITYESIPKLAIKQKMREEAKSEEMRILYVALTRAREKLIVTSMEQNIDKKSDEWSRKLTPYLVSTSNSFAEWIGRTIFSTKNDWQIQKWSYTNAIMLNKDYTDDSYKTLLENIEKTFNLTEDFEKISNKFEWKYSYNSSTKLPSKITVTELKRLGDETLVSEEQTQLSQEVDMQEAPSFISETGTTATMFGTLLHNVMQRIDFNDFNIDIVLNAVEEKYKKKVRFYLEQFKESDLFFEIKNSKRIWREMPFNLSMNVGDVYSDVKDESKDDKVLIQGVIDLYFENEEGDLVLVDYKTDKLDSEVEFVKRYKVQLDYYKKALETLTQKHVSKVIIYSFNLNKEINLWWITNKLLKLLKNNDKITIIYSKGGTLW